MPNPQGQHTVCRYAGNCQPGVFQGEIPKGDTGVFPEGGGLPHWPGRTGKYRVGGGTHKPNINTKKFGVAIRTGYPYQSIHQPWYRDSSIVTEEELYYQKHAKQNISNYSVNITNKELENRTKQKLNLLENIFSITNIGAYKQINILGINLKFKRRKVNC